MTCEEAEHYLLENYGREMSPEVSAHVAGCQSCREFAKVLSLTAVDKGHALVEPSLKLDAAVLLTCAAEMRCQRRMHLLWKTLRVSAVACVVFLLSWQMLSFVGPFKFVKGKKTVATVQAVDNTAADDDMLISMVVADKMFRDWEADVDLAWMKSLEPVPETTVTMTESADLSTESPLGELNSDMLDVELILMDNMR